MTIVLDSTNCVEAQNTSAQLVQTQSLAPGASDNTVLFAKPSFFPRLEAQHACSSLTWLCLFTSISLPQHVSLFIARVSSGLIFFIIFDSYITGHQHRICMLLSSRLNVFL